MTKPFALLSIISTSIATNPCQLLCELDGPSVCTNGSWPQGANVCHAYFRRSSGDHCYHNTATRIQCPDSLPALTISEAEAILAARGAPTAANPSSGTNPRIRRAIAIVPSSDPSTTISTESTTTINPSTDSTTDTSTTHYSPRTERRRHVFIISSANPATQVGPFVPREATIESTTTISPSTETTTETTTESTTHPTTERRRRVFVMSSANSSTRIESHARREGAIETTTSTTPAAQESRRRVFPIHAAVTQATHVSSVSGNVSQAGRMSATHTSQARPVVSARHSFTSPNDAADYIGSVFEAGIIGRLDEFVWSIATALSETSTWPSRFTRENALEFWARSRGAELHAITEPSECRQLRQNECTALLLLISHMPLPNTDDSSSILFLEEIGIMAFIEANMEAIRARLVNSVRQLSNPMDVGYSTDRQSVAALRGWARNWMTRFPHVIGDSAALKAIVIKHQIFSIDVGILGGRAVSLTITRANPLVALATQLDQYRLASVRQGIDHLRYSGEISYGEGLIREFYSVVSKAVQSEGSAQLFATHDASGYLRMISGATAVGGLEAYRGFGQFLALSIIGGIPTGLLLPSLFFKHLLGQSVSLEDVESFDEEWARSARMYMQAKSNEELHALNYADDEPLPGSGATEPVTIENRAAQLEASISNFITNNSPAQFAAIASGFFAILPRQIFAGFEGQDLQSLLVGTTDIIAGDLIAMIDSGRMPSTHSAWLYQIIREFTPDLRQRFLRFVTGLSVLPVGGWQELGVLSVHPTPRLEGSAIALPRSQTCFKKMILPTYDSLEEMREILTNVLTLSLDAGMHERR